jgi:hypothetical protein
MCILLSAVRPHLRRPCVKMKHTDFELLTKVRNYDEIGEEI